MTLHDSCPDVRLRIAPSLQDGFPSVYDGFRRFIWCRSAQKTSVNQWFDGFRRSAHRLKTAKNRANRASSHPSGPARSSLTLPINM